MRREPSSLELSSCVTLGKFPLQQHSEVLFSISFFPFDTSLPRCDGPRKEKGMGFIIILETSKIW